MDVLIDSTQSVIDKVDHETGEVSLQHDLDWSETTPVYIAGSPVEVLAKCEDSFWIGDTSSVSVGDVLVCSKQLGTMPEIFAAFESFWKEKWSKHANVPWSQWEQILAFAERVLPSVTAPKFSPTLDGFRSAASKKKRQAATGPDGVSRDDVLNLTDLEVQSLLSLFDRVMETGEWPDQLLEGSIRSLAKRQSASGVSDYRPVTVYSFLYRTWSSMAARHWMGQLDSIFAPQVFGSRTGKCASHMWRLVLDQLDFAQQNDAPVGGVVFDLHAAFNLLPRLPVLGFAKLAGVDAGTLLAWSSFLAGNSRRFVVRGCVSNAVRSTCGMPEGCALSCLGMALVDQVFLLWLRHLEPAAVGYTYVDDWEVVSSSDQCIRRAISATQSYAEAMDLLIDAKKSYCWGSHRKLRQALRPLGFPVLLDARSLGAHVVYCRQVRNGTIQQRLEELEGFWPKLSASYGSHHQKCMAIRISAWPRVMHSISASVLGLKHFVALRSQALQSLGFQKPGANPMLHFLLDPGHLDPHLYATVVTLRDHRAIGCSTAQLELLSSAAEEDLGSHNTVSQILVQRVHQLGWAIGSDAMVTDCYGTFSLGHISWQELDVRLRWAWQNVVSVGISHRLDFASFRVVDVRATRTCLAALTPCEQGILRRLLNGSLLTNRDAWRWSADGSDRCAFCGLLDSTKHRLWECAHTEDLRAALPPEALQVVSSLPLACTEHAWFLLPPSTDAWRQALLSLSPMVGPLCPVPSAPGLLLDFFTDGSCLWPTNPEYRLAAWAVVLAGPVTLCPKVKDVQLLAADVLPGLLQTPYRAELFAVAFTLAVCVDLQIQSSIRIWSDCLSVVVKCRLLLEGGWVPTSATPHSDLWRWVWSSLEMLGRGRVQVCKVEAHVNLQQVDNDLLYWRSLHNFCADEAARVANLARPQWFWNLWQLYTDEVVTYQRLGDCIARHAVSCMQRWFHERGSEVVPAVPAPKPKKEFPMQWEGPDVTYPRGRFVKAFGTNLDEKFRSWWGCVFDVDSTAALKWISFSQLFLHWMIHQSHPGVVKIGKKWVDAGDEVAGSCRNYNFRTRSKWFRLMFQEFVKSCGIKIGYAVLKPHTDHLNCHIGCVSAPMAVQAWEQVESWLRCRVHRPIRLPEQLDSLSLEM